MRKARVGALIIKDKKLLVITAYHASFYWTPGGGIEDGENHADALVRELAEELQVELISHKPYLEYEYSNQISGQIETNHNYLVEIKGAPAAAGEILDMYWLSKEDFEQQKIPLPKMMKQQLLPKLIQEGFL